MADTSAGDTTSAGDPDLKKIKNVKGKFYLQKGQFFATLRNDKSEIQPVGRFKDGFWLLTVDDRITAEGQRNFFALNSAEQKAVIDEVNKNLESKVPAEVTIKNVSYVCFYVDNGTYAVYPSNQEQKFTLQGQDVQFKINRRGSVQELKGNAFQGLKRGTNKKHILILATYENQARAKSVSDEISGESSFPPRGENTESNVEREVNPEEKSNESGDAGMRQLNEQVEQLKAVNAELENLRAKNTNLEESLKEANEGIKGLGAEKIALQAKIRELEASNSDLKSDSSKKDNRIEAQLKTIKALSRRKK